MVLADCFRRDKVKKVTKMAAVVSVLPSHGPIFARAQWSLDGVAEVIDFDRKTNVTPDPNVINANMYKSYYTTNGSDIFGDGTYSKEIRFDLKSSL